MRPTIAAVTLVFLAPPLAAEEPGNLWEVTTSMEGGGVSMPGRTQQVCAPVNAEGPEAMSAGDDRCQMSDVQRSPGRFSFKVQCPEGSGTGEMTYQGNDSYTQVMTMTMDGTTMKMVTQGRRTGSCDASQAKKQLAAIQGQAAAGVAQACGSVVEQMIPAQLEGLGCDASYKTRMCERLGTNAGFTLAAARQPMGNAMVDSGTLPELARFCGTDADSLRERLCSDAGRTEDLDFIGGNCPALAQPIAQRECAGRGFTTPPAEKYRDFCATYAQEMADGGSGAGEPAATEPAATPSADDVLKEGAKRLKGLFGR